MPIESCPCVVCSGAVFPPHEPPPEITMVERTPVAVDPHPRAQALLDSMREIEEEVLIMELEELEYDYEHRSNSVLPMIMSVGIGLIWLAACVYMLGL